MIDIDGHYLIDVFTNVCLKLMIKKYFSQYAKMYLVHVQVARPITTRNKQAYLKTCSTSFVTEKN